MMDMMIDLTERRKAAEILCKAICGNERGLCVSTPENCWQSKMVELYKLETVDAVPVVRCKDCKWILKHSDEATTFGRCSLTNVFVELNDFCSRGESLKKDG